MFFYRQVRRTDFKQPEFPQESSGQMMRYELENENKTQHEMKPIASALPGELRSRVRIEERPMKNKQPANQVPERCHLWTM